MPRIRGSPRDWSHAKTLTRRWLRNPAPTIMPPSQCRDDRLRVEANPQIASIHTDSHWVYFTRSADKQDKNPSKSVESVDSWWVQANADSWFNGAAEAASYVRCVRSSLASGSRTRNSPPSAPHVTDRPVASR